MAFPPPSKPKKPKKEGVKGPESSNLKSAHNHFSGIRSKNGQTHIKHCDNPFGPLINIQATGDIYIEADSNKQRISNSSTYVVDATLTRYLGELNTFLTGKMDIKVASDSTHTINTDLHEKIIGNHVIAITGKQDVKVDVNQTVTITGNRDVIVKGGNLLETIKGSETRKVTGPAKSNSNATHDEVLLGGVLMYKGATESGLVNSAKATVTLALENTITGSVHEKVEAGIAIEINVAFKKVIHAGSIFETKVGPHGGLNIAMRDVTAAINKIATKTGNTATAAWQGISGAWIDAATMYYGP